MIGVLESGLRADRQGALDPLGDAHASHAKIARNLSDSLAGVNSRAGRRGDRRLLLSRFGGDHNRGRPTHLGQGITRPRHSNGWSNLIRLRCRPYRSPYASGRQPLGTGTGRGRSPRLGVDAYRAGECCTAGAAAPDSRLAACGRSSPRVADALRFGLRRQAYRVARCARTSRYARSGRRPPTTRTDEG
jgi:hypothetical protein